MRARRLIFTMAMFLVCVAFASPAGARYSDDLEAEQIYREGTHLMEAERYALAIPLLEKAISRDHNFIAAYVNLSLSYNAIGNYEKGYATADRAIKIYPHSAYLYYHRAVALINLKRPKEALADYQLAVRLDPAGVDENLGLAGAYKELGDLTRANEWYSKTASLTANSSREFFDKGLANFNLGNYRESISDFVRAEHLNPKNSDAFYNHGLALVSIGRYKDAIPLYSKSIALFPNNAQPYYTRAVAELLTGNYTNSIADFRKNVQLTKWNEAHAPYCALFGSIALRKLGKSAEATSFLVEASHHLSGGAWPSPVVSYLLRKTPAKDLLSAANTNDLASEARTYMGIDLSLDKKGNQAIDQLTWVKNNGNKTFSEYQLALVELNKLQSR